MAKKKTGFWDGFGKLVDHISDATTVASRECIYDDSTGTVRVIETMKTGTKKTRIFVESNLTIKDH